MNNELKPYSEFENITLYNDNCLKVMKNMENSSIDLIVTDPPYLVTAKGCAGTMGGYWKEKSANCGKIFEYNNISCDLYLP